MKTVKDSIYNYPKYYDLVYGSDWQAEIDFFVAVFDRWVEFPVKRVFEPACGTGRLLFRLAKMGYQVSGIDLNEASIEFCNHRLQRLGLEPTAAIADITDFQLAEPAHAAFNTINSFRHLVEQQPAINHLRCVANALVPDGVYILGLHLTPEKGDPITEESWSSQQGHLAVNTTMWLDHGDIDQRYEDYIMRFDVYTPTKQFRIEDTVRFRTYTANEFFGLLYEVPELEVIETYDFSYEIDDSITIDPYTEDVVFVLRKVAT